jgi:hypothetical protein
VLPHHFAEPKEGLMLDRFADLEIGEDSWDLDPSGSG